METASIRKWALGSKPPPGAGGALAGRVSVPGGGAFEVAGVLVLLAGAFAAYFLLGTYPIFDGYYSLVWSREILDGSLPSFEAFRAPTEHPAALIYGMILEPIFGTRADRALVLSTLISFAALAAAVYRIGWLAFGRAVGVVAALLVLTRFDYVSLALRAYIDIPYLALVFWAAALEMGRPRRGHLVFAMLALAGLMRPEVWMISVIYLIYAGWNADWRRRAGYVAWVAVGPIVWFGVDWIVTGNPLYSLTATREFVESVGRSRAAWHLPIDLVVFTKDQLKTPVLLFAVIGYVLALWKSPWRSRAAVPLALVAVGSVRFLAGGVFGFAVIPRYLVIMTVGLCVFAAFALFGWVAYRPAGGAGAAAATDRPATSRWPWRRIWIAGCVAGLALLGFYTYRAQRSYIIFAKDMAFQSDVHRSFHVTLGAPEVRRALASCPTLIVPTHKWVPEGRFLADRPGLRVVALSQAADAPLPTEGVAVYAFGRKAWNIYGHAENIVGVAPFVGVPLPGFSRLETSKGDYSVAYVKCGPV